MGGIVHEHEAGGSETKVEPVLVACLGDVMLDVIVEVEHSMVPDDDTPAAITFAAGGQAANVATWVRALGGRARVLGPRSDYGPGHLVERALTDHGVEVWGTTTGRTGAVISMVSHGSRSMASDPGDLTWLDEVRSGPWLEGADWQVDQEMGGARRELLLHDRGNHLLARVEAERTLDRDENIVGG